MTLAILDGLREGDATAAEAAAAAERAGGIVVVSNA